MAQNPRLAPAAFKNDHGPDAFPGISAVCDDPLNIVGFPDLT